MKRVSRKVVLCDLVTLVVDWKGKMKISVNMIRGLAG